LIQPDSMVQVSGGDVLSSLSPSISKLRTKRLVPVPVSDLSRALILYPVPENTIREALKKIVNRRSTRDEESMVCDSRFEEIVDDEDVEDTHSLEDAYLSQEEEGDGMVMDDRFDRTSRYDYYDDDMDPETELKVEELGSSYEEEEEEEEEEDEAARLRPVRGYMVETPAEDEDDDYAMNNNHYNTTPFSSNGGFGPSPLPPIPSSSWHGIAPPPTPLATSFSSPNGIVPTDMNSFFSMVTGRLNSQRQPPLNGESEVVPPSFDNTMPSADVEPVEG